MAIRKADIGVFRSPVNGMNEPHPEGSYVRLGIDYGETVEHVLLSRGAAESLRDELVGLLSTPPVRMQRTYATATCRGSLILGTGCGKCAKCVAERDRLNPPGLSVEAAGGALP